MNKILVVEDDAAIREGIKGFLQSHNFLVDEAEDGAIALAKVKKSQPDLVILDLGLPKISGESVCREIKKDYPEISVIMLTAKNRSEDVVGGFTSGADDYISKPFELDELLARVTARLKGNSDEKVQVADLVLDPQSVSVTRAGKSIKLSPHEFKLLHYLMNNKGKVLSRDMILNRVWQYSYDVDSRVVDVYIGYLRKKIDHNSKKKLISSVRGFGYVIKE
ncbi:MAG TPA: response regulator transcription factor [Patescibacteria group bacterium]|nr:response regulator transcription factor [Patescibacteria group bacterium]